MWLPLLKWLTQTEQFNEILGDWLLVSAQICCGKRYLN